MKRDLYSEVTARILAELERGAAPWRKSWSATAGQNVPQNAVTNRPYSGCNVILLWLARNRGWATPRFLTFKQATEAGGNVRKGEHATHVILWKPVPKKQSGDEGEEKDGSYLLLRSYAVFNAQQADNVPELPLAVEHDPIEKAEEIVRGYVPHGPLIQFGGGSAHYVQSSDIVACPNMGQFERIEGYYSTLYHELVHSTGHESRLDRLTRTGFGSGPYAKEELIAEMGAAMLCGMAGIDNLDQSASYLKGWLKPIGEDPKFVIQAAANAQKAADLILGTSFVSDSQESENRELVAA